MQFIRRNINKTLRNGDIIASSISTSQYTSGSGGGSGVFSGDYLPATMNDENIYIVPHYVTFQETTTTTDTDGNETETIKNLLEITKDGIIVNGNIIASGEVSAYGSGSTSGGSNVDIDLSNYYTKDEVDALIDNIDVSGIDLTEYSKTSHTHSNYSLTSHTHSGYALTSHTHAISAITDLQTTLDSKTPNTAFTAHTASTTVHITSDDRNNWNNKLNKSVWDSVFEIDDSNNLRVKLNLIGEKDVSAYGSGETGNTSIDFENYYTKEEVDDLISNVDIGDIDLSGYSKTSHTHSNYALTSHTHSGYALTSHTHAISAITNLQSTLDGKSSTSHTHTQYASSSHTHPQYASSSHTHAISAITNLQSTLDSKATNAALTAHTANTTYHITSAERTKWNNTNTNFNDWFYKDSSGNIHSKYNFIGDSEVSAYGSGETGNTSISLENYYTKDEVNDLIDNIDTSNVDLSGYSKTSHTHSNYALTSHTHSVYYDSSISRTKNTVLAAPNGSNGSATFRALVAADIPSLAISKITNLQTTLDGKSGTGHSHSNYSLTSHTHSAYATTGHTHSSLTFSGGTFSAKTYNPSGATTVNIPTHTSHITNNSGYITSGATVAAANKVTSTLTFSGGTFSANTYNGSAAKTIYIPTNTTHLTNGSGYITTAATVANATKFSGYTMRSAASWVNNSVEAYIQYTIDATSLSTSNFYPIIFPTTHKDLYVRMYSTPSSSSAAYNQNKLEFTFRGQGWADTPKGLTVHFYNCYTASETTIGCIGMGTEGGCRCIWVRGGVTYYVVSNITPTLKTANFTNGDEIYTTGTTLQGGTNTKVTVYWTPQTTSGLGTLYHSGGLGVGGSASIAGTLTSTGAISGKSGAVITGTTISTALLSNYLKYNSGYMASISSAGWYRFATSSVPNNYGGTYIFSIRRTYNNTNNEAYIISCTVDYGKVHWAQLNGSANTRLITQIRCTYTNNSTMYFDFYYSGTTANDVYVNAVGNCTLQTPTKTTSALTTSSALSLTDGLKIGTNSAYPITLFRDNTSGGAYIRYGALGQLTYSWAAGSDSAHNFAWYYKNESAGIDAQKMYLTSGGTLVTVGDVTAYSDKRLKKNIKPLEVRGELNPVTYEKDGKENIGFLAQEVQELYPELVHTDEGTEEKYLSLNYAQLTAVLYAEIKELKERLSKLENE